MTEKHNWKPRCSNMRFEWKRLREMRKKKKIFVMILPGEITKSFGVSSGLSLGFLI